jgi:stearoyl-CoA desaturase (Delta-9 desaturase)
MVTALIFFCFYCVSMTYTSVFYHRTFTHGAVELSPRFRKFVIATGMWFTGIDLKGWVCMHRLHHEFSDTEKDPHSPVFSGLWYTFIQQHKSFERILIRLIRGRKEYTDIVKDLEFDVHWLNRKGLWWVPFAVQFAVGVVIAYLSGHIAYGLAYFFGITGHPVQGYLVNSFGHAMGYRNFDEPDNSRNNLPVAFFVFGEGLQNNHHRYPNSARFSVRWFEPDFGFWVVRLLTLLGLAKVKSLAPSLEHAEIRTI